MAIKKSELYSSLWKSCDELRGGMDASQYKDYVLVLLFVKYVSDKYAGQPNALIEVPKGGSFADMVALKGDKEIGDKINKIIARLAETNDLKGVIDVADFNDADRLGKGKEMQDRLSNLVAIFENPALNFHKNRAEGDDLLGDAYEYLMRNFATESGKSKGQFYTPAEVSRVMAKVIGINKARSQSQTIYDPTSGSGSLLLKYSRMVSVAEIETNDYNLNIPRYIDSTEAEDLQDIEAHLLGGIPNYDIDALDGYWQVFPTLKQQLFEAGPRAGYSQLRVDVAQIKPTIFAHPEFVAYIQTVTTLFEQWQTSNVPCLKALDVGSHPKQLIEVLSEDMLRVIAEARLIDKYDLYQHLMSYWTDTMQDDVYMIALDGWKANSDLVPSQLIINRYFVAEQQSIEKLEAARDAITSRFEELDEEQGGEGGLLEEAKNEKGKITKASVKVRLKDIFGEPDATDERVMLTEYLDLLEQETEANKKIKDAQKALDAKMAAKYSMLSEDEVKTLVIEDKWMAILEGEVQAELSRISQALTGRIKELAERYATPLRILISETEALTKEVEKHLANMGFNY